MIPCLSVYQFWVKSVSGNHGLDSSNVVLCLALSGLFNVVLWRRVICSWVKKNGKVACFDLTTEVIEEIDFKGESENCLIVPYKKNFGTIGEIDN